MDISIGENMGHRMICPDCHKWVGPGEHHNCPTPCKECVAKDAEIERLREAVEWATEQIPDCLTEYCGDGLTRAWSGYGFKAELRRRAYGEGNNL